MTNDDKDLKKLLENKGFDTEAVEDIFWCIKEATTQQPNDDKDLKPCPFCGQDSAICNQDDNGLWYVYCNNDFCFAEITEVTSQEAVIEKWNTRSTTQQPSEPLKELDKEELWKENYKAVWDALDLVWEAINEISPMPSQESLLPPEPGRYAEEMVKAVAKFGQPSEKKALSIQDIWKIANKIDYSIDDYEFRGDAGDYTPSDNEKILMNDYLQGYLEEFVTAILSALPAQREVRYPEKAEHSKQCFYVLEPRYFGNPSKEKFCDCGAFERNLTIDEFKKLNGG